MRNGGRGLKGKEMRRKMKMVRKGKWLGKSAKEERTSEAVTISAFQSIRGNILTSNFGLGSISADSNSQSLGCKGKEAEDDLQALTAQERKLRVRSFILSCVSETAG
jgi:hypothetical protein